MAQKSKFFRVATEGATTDGRQIERTWIQQMAKNFNPKKYGARVWLEHLRGIHPESSFKAYGDVSAVESREVEDGKIALFAQIEPLPELVAMNKAKQKIYTSIEVHPKFADTGEAYLTGLAVTDSPASLGTEVLSFAQQYPDANPFKGRKSAPETLFSEAVPVTLEFEDDAPGLAEKFGDQIKSLLAQVTGKGKTDDARFASVLKGFEDFAQVVQQQAQAHDTLAADHAKLAQDFAQLSTQHATLVKQLEGTTAQNHTQRPAAAGGAGVALTDC